MDAEQLFAALKFFPVIALKLFDLIGLAGKGLDDAHTAEILLQGGGEDGILFLVGLIRFGYLFKEVDRRNENKRNNYDRKQAEAGVDPEQSNEVDNEEQTDAADADGLIAVKFADGIDIGCATRDKIAGIGLSVIGEG